VPAVRARSPHTMHGFGYQSVRAFTGPWMRRVAVVGASFPQAARNRQAMSSQSPRQARADPHAMQCGWQAFRSIEGLRQTGRRCSAHCPKRPFSSLPATFGSWAARRLRRLFDAGRAPQPSSLSRSLINGWRPSTGPPGLQGAIPISPGLHTSLHLGLGDARLHGARRDRTGAFGRLGSEDVPKLQWVLWAELDERHLIGILLSSDLRRVRRIKLSVDHFCDALLDRRSDFIGA
jgi:hypothetical protein